MKCIYCTHKKTEVTNSREVKGSYIVWRRRKCLTCKKVFTTTENAFADNLFVIKSNKKRQRFVYEKLFASLFSIINRKKLRDNGDDAQLAKKIAWKIIHHTLINPLYYKNVPTSFLISTAYTELKKIDPVSADTYIYYSDFRRKVGSEMKLIRP